MKKIVIFIFVISISLNSFAQDESEEKFFKKENLFTGGTLNVSFGDQITALGISPYFGYSFNKFIELAVSPGINYVSQRDYEYIGDKLRQTIYGPGSFVRLFPVKFLFVQGQYEFNLIRYHYIPAIGSSLNNDKLKYDAHSFLVGGGYANGRDFSYQKSYYYFSVMWDIAKAPHSPYIDNLHRAVPIFRAGYTIALFQGKR